MIICFSFTDYVDGYLYVCNCYKRGGTGGWQLFYDIKVRYIKEKIFFLFIFQFIWKLLCVLYYYITLMVSFRSHIRLFIYESFYRIEKCHIPVIIIIAKHITNVTNTNKPIFVLKYCIGWKYFLYGIAFIYR